MSTQLSIPEGATATATPIVGSGGSSYGRIVDSPRLLTYGSTSGRNVYKSCELKDQTVAPGAPGTTNLDLLAQTPLGGGATMIGVAGKLVYLAVVLKTGSDLRIRKAGGTALELLSGTTDTLTVCGDAVLVNVRESTDTLVSTGLAFDATHKNLQFESTAGCTFDLLYGVI